MVRVVAKLYPPAGENRLAAQRMLGELPQGHRVMFERTCDYRPPKKGEWYLSGAVPEAYRAIGDLYDSFQIVRPVQAVEVQRWEVWP